MERFGTTYNGGIVGEDDSRIAKLMCLVEEKTTSTFTADWESVVEFA